MEWVLLLTNFVTVVIVKKKCNVMSNDPKFKHIDVAQEEKVHFVVDL